MKKAKILIGLACALLVSCQSVEPEILPPPESGFTESPQPVAIQQISEDVNSAEVDNIIESLFGKNKKSRSNNYNVVLYKDSVGKDRVIAINFDDNQGYVLLSALKTHKPVLAYATEGNFTIPEDKNDPINIWWGVTMEDVANSINLPADSLQKISRIWEYFRNRDELPVSRSYGNEEDHSRLKNLTDEQYSAFSRQIMDRMAEWSQKGYRFYPIDDYDGSCDLGDKNAMANYVRGRVNPEYADDYWAFTFVVEIDHDVKLGKGQTMKTEWSQEDGYNQCFDYKTNGSGERQPVGCGPIAVGQVMYYYRHPAYFDWNNMTISGQGNAVTSRFLLDVHAKCNAKYNPVTDATGTDEAGLINALRTYGYSFENPGPSGVTHNNILYKSPVIVGSYLTLQGSIFESGHAWIIDGGMYRETGAEVEIWSINYSDTFERFYLDTSGVYSQYYFYVNWGWGGATSTYYNLDSMFPPVDGTVVTNNRFATVLMNIKPQSN